MAWYNTNLSGDQVKRLLTSDEGLKGLVGLVVNQVLEAHVGEHLAVDHYKRNNQRRGCPERLPYEDGLRPCGGADVTCSAKPG